MSLTRARGDGHGDRLCPVPALNVLMELPMNASDTARAMNPAHPDLANAAGLNDIAHCQRIRLAAVLSTHLDNLF